MINRKDIGRMPKDFRNMVMSMSMARIYTHFKDGMFGIVSAWKAGRDDKENLDAMSELIEDIRSMDYGYVPLIGYWDDQEKRSIFVPQISQKEVQELSNKYDQKAYMHGSDGYWVVYSSTGNEIAHGTEFKVSSIDNEVENYSMWKQRKFKLETIIANIKRKLDNEILSYEKRRHLEKTLEGYRKKIKKTLTF